MPWMLQPHNWTQAIRPNLYNVDYRRVGAYKGMGRFVGQGLGLIGRGGLHVFQSHVRSGFGQTDSSWCPSGDTNYCLMNLPTTTGSLVMYPPSSTVQASSQLLPQITASGGGTVPTWLPWAVGGGLFLILLTRKR